MRPYCGTQPTRAATRRRTMPKRGFAKEHSSREEKELRQAAKYHWEFKRRNPGYRSWWQQGLRETTKPEGWDERFNPDLSFEEVIKSSVPRAIEEFLAIIGDSPLRETFVKPPGLQAAFEHRLMRNLVLQGVKEDMGRGRLTI